MLGGGIALLAIDGRPYKQDCSGMNVDVDGRCRYRYDTLAGGAALTGVGIAAFVVGISTGLVVFSRKRNAKPEKDDFDEDTVHVQPILGPTSAGLRVRF